jgi:hypothetical protein
VRELVVGLRPRPVVADVIRRVPAARVAWAAEAPTLALGDSGPAPRATTTPVATDQFRMGITIGREFKDELDEIKGLLSHKVPDGDLEGILRECVRVTRRCGSAHRVEFHHVVPYQMGGGATTENITLHCQRHHFYRAVQDYGAEHMMAAMGP